MAPPLPDELLKMIVESTTDKSTLRSLLLVCHQFHNFAESVFLQNVTIIVNDPRPTRSPLIPFQEFMTVGNGQRCLRMKSFTVSFPTREPSVEDITILNDLIPKFSALKSLSLTIRGNRSLTPDHSALTIFNNLPSNFSLQSLSLDLRYSKAPNLAKFLVSQSALEYLALPSLVSTLGLVGLGGSPTAFQRLRHLWAPLTFAIAPLSSSGGGVICLKTSLDRDYPIVPAGQLHLDALQTLSCTVRDRDAFSNFVSLAKNLRFLEIYCPRAWNAPEAIPTRDILDRINGTQIEHVRCLLDSSWTAPQIRKLFQNKLLPPSLRCIEVQKVSRSGHLCRPESSLSHRFYRGETRKKPVPVEWKCEPGEEWVHDWDKDVYVLQ